MGNLVVSRVGDGAAALSGNTAAVFLDEFTTGGTPSGNSVTIPTTASGSNFAFTLGGTSASQGQLTRSADGYFLTMYGYDAPTGLASPSSAGTNQGRVVARVGAPGVADTTTRFLAAGTTPRSAVSDNGTGLWVASDVGSNAGGLRYTTYGSSSSGTQLNSATTNMRTVNIFNGQLYIGSSTGVGGDFRGVSSVGTGLPTAAGQTFTLLTGMGGNNLGATDSTYDFYFADANTVYVTDDDTAAPASAGLQKWTFNGTTWVKQWTVASGTTNVGFRSITGLVTSSGVQLYAISGETSGNRLVSLLDNGTITNASVATTLATAGTNQIFRGVEFAPIPEPGAFLFGLALTGIVGGVTAYRRRK